MQRKTKQALAFIAIVALFMQTLFGSLPAMATGNLSPLHITMTTNGQPYNEGDTATSPVEVQVTTTSGDSAGIEISQDARTTWQPFDDTQPLVITEEGKHELWFRLADVEERRIIKIGSQLAQPLRMTSAIIYVTEDGNGNKDGTSWTDAFGDLQEALVEASTMAQPVQIWVAAGTYKPTEQIDSSDPRTATFQMQNNVAIYGGFDGTEINLAARDWENNETILSGDIGTVGDNTDNVYHVFYHPAGLDLDETAILDGVTIKEGNADINSDELQDPIDIDDPDDPHNYGGGMHNNGGSPTLQNVTFESNTANAGGGVYNASSSPTLKNVTFSNNEVDWQGGGMVNEANSTPILTEVIFESNIADLGGGMANEESNPTLTEVTFKSNIAYVGGGGMYNEPNSSPTLTKVTFESNEAALGGGMFNGGKSSPTLTEVTFSSNVAFFEGGGMFNMSNSTPTLTEVTFDKNTAESGGGMYNENSSPALTGVTFSSNTAANEGGGMYNLGSSPMLTNVIFSSNTAELGGGMYNEEFIPADSNSPIEESSPMLINVTMSGNETKSANKGSIYGGNPRISNSIIVGNNNGEPALHSDVIGTIENSLLDVEESGTVVAKFHANGDIQTETYTPTDIFLDPANQDYRLKIKSPAIDKGNTTTYKDIEKELLDRASTEELKGILSRALQTDLAERPRIQGRAIDLGAYEATTYYVDYHPNNAMNGTVPKDDQIYEENDEVTVQGNSGDLTRVGYTFADWNTQVDGKGTSYKANDTFRVTTNTTLYAQWITNNYTVTFEPNGGSDVAEQQVPYNERVIEPPMPSKQGHTFVGWYKDSRFTMKWDFTADVVTEAITLYAKWQVNSNPPPADGGSNTTPISNDNSPSEKVKITLHTNGGTAIAPIDIAYNTKISDLPVPTREGYRFDGWYQDEELTKPWAADTVLRENISLYAKWTAMPVEEPEPPQEPQPEPPKLTVTFSDIERHWAKEMIEELATEGIIQGFEDGTFRPNESISRMHVAALLTRAFSFEQVREGNDFKDVSPTHPYYKAIMALQQAGIVDGTNGAFLPNERMTRAQLAKVLVGLMGRTPEGISSFADVDQKHWSAGYIAVLEQEGIALGDNGKFRPNDPVTRAQFITFLYRVIQTVDK
ncbi:InlB B-repeat-containing protein [Lysinibacillus macroides]|uniref:InlB B-repeat-containing protein n=1 Tax=Lysinibacillus macroides TaxID=33935 RepID=UPI0009F85A2C|nr:InlB B-repeat-containing protein [Lysinibacillus macroides]